MNAPLMLNAMNIHLRSAPLRVHILIYPGFKALEAVATMTVFQYANMQLAARGLGPAYEVSFAALKLGYVPSDMPLSLEATKTVDLSNLPDVAVIVGSPRIEQALQENAQLVNWTREAAPHVERLVALCSGCFFLADAGLLDGERATTHWSVADLLAKKYPNIVVEADSIFLRAGRLWTSAGVTAGIDLALGLVEEDLGRSIALDVARDLVVYLKRAGGQSQFSVHLASQKTNHPGIHDLQNWILSHLDEPLNLAQLSSRAAMSERNFRRVFQRETGASPAEFVDRARLDAARRLLEECELPVKTIATRVGLNTEQALRKLFLRFIGITPRDYQARFSSGRAECTDR